MREPIRNRNRDQTVARHIMGIMMERVETGSVFTACFRDDPQIDLAVSAHLRHDVYMAIGIGPRPWRWR